MFVIAQQRRDAGKPVWDRKISLGDVFHNDEMTFTERRDAIVARIKGSGWMKLHEHDSEFETILEQMSSMDDPDDFDYWWDELYDYADDERVWIDTTTNPYRTADPEAVGL